MTTNTDTQAHGGGVEAVRTSTDVLIDDCWEGLCERDDRTSPAEYPDMCLITHAELAEFMSRAASPAAPAPAAGVELPEEMTPAIADALSIMLWTSGSLARAYRAVGFDIPCKAEAEQAFVLFRTLRFAIQHGDDWRAAAQDELTKLRAAIPAPDAKGER
jgi:hypothetical protein